MIKSYSKYSKYKKSYKVKNKKRFVFGRVFLIFPAIMVFGGIFYLIIFSSVFQVKAIEISGLQKIPEIGLRDIVEQNLQKTILFFPSKSIFLVDFKKIQKEALGQYPQLDAIKIKRKFPKDISITIEEKKPVAVLVADNTKFFIDKKGIIFEEITDSPPILPNLAIDGLDQDLNLGREIIDAGRLAKIIDAAAKLKSDFGVEAAVFQVAGSDKLIVETKEGWEFYLNLEGDVDWQLTKLGVVLEEKIPPERRRDLEYVELRFGNFAPYKYKNHASLRSAEP